MKLDGKSLVINCPDGWKVNPVNPAFCTPITEGRN